MDTESTIVINGRQYNNIEEMPPDVRVLYQKVINSLREGKMTHDTVPLVGEGKPSRNLHNTSMSYAGPGSIEPQSTFSSLSRGLIFGVVLLAAFMGLNIIYYAVG